MGDYGGPIAQDRMWREEISRDAIENSNGANGFLARGPYRAITRWHVLTIFQPLNPRAPLLPFLPSSLSKSRPIGAEGAALLSVWLSPSLCCCMLKSLFLFSSATVNISKHLKKEKIPKSCSNVCLNFNLKKERKSKYRKKLTFCNQTVYGLIKQNLINIPTSSWLTATLILVFRSCVFW